MRWLRRPLAVSMTSTLVLVQLRHKLADELGFSE